MGSLAGFLNNRKSLLGIAAGLGLASPSSDQELNSMVGSSVGYLLEKSAKMMVSNEVIGAICSWNLAGFTKRCLLTCHKDGAGDWQSVGLSVATVTTVRPC